MMVAQKLYEAGKITYMRTDSVNLSQDALAMQQKMEITKFIWSRSMRKEELYSKKAKGAQEAHEAIRPSYMQNKTVLMAILHIKNLYDLIWKRTISSQMADAKIDRTVVKINLSNS